MATKDNRPATAFILLTAWCTVTRQWLELPGRFDTVQDAQRLAVERGIYHVVYQHDGRRLGMEPFAVLGDD
jgi:hypothetical protein